MDSFRIEGLAEDVRILSLGTLFRSVDGSRWNISIQFSPKQTKTSLTMSNAPILARRRTLNQTKFNSPSGWKESFEILKTDDWLVKKIRDCPAIGHITKTEGDQFCFVFQLANGKTVYLPQFELARALFFHDSYLSRTSLEPSCLMTEFNVQINEDTGKGLINVMPIAGYSINLLNEPSCRRLLSWILMDADARASYESIGKNQKLYGIDQAGYRRWDFQFTPPSLPNAGFKVRGKFDADSNSLFVFEIDSVSNIKAAIPAEIDIYHPGFSVAVNGTGKGGVAPPSGSSEEFVIQDGEPANENSQRVIIYPSSTGIEFSKAFKVSKQARKERPSSSGQLDEGLVLDLPSDVSVDESIADQGVPGADWNNINNITDDTHLYESKFKCFMKMIDVLVSRYGCVILSKDIRKLPVVPRCKKHLLSTDGNPRCLAVIKMTVKNKTCYLLEVDTSDADKPLSTQLLSVSYPDNWEKDLEELEWELVRCSLRWPAEYLVDICGESRYKGIPHPRTESFNKGMLAPESVERWAGRFYSWMCHL
jgi:hypothetical protein